MLPFFFIDEVHCLVETSHQFQPEYKKLGIIKDKFKKSTKSTILTIEHYMHLTEAIHIKLPTVRKNLFLKVIEKNSNDAMIKDAKQYLIDNQIGLR